MRSRLTLRTDPDGVRPNLLQKIFALGESMGTALDSEDLDQFFALTEERGTLLEGLNAYEHPAEICPDWQQLASALKEQHQRITGAIAAQERRLTEGLGSIEKYKGAQQSYSSPPPRNSILHQDVHG